MRQQHGAAEPRRVAAGAYERRRVGGVRGWLCFQGAKELRQRGTQVEQGSGQNVPRVPACLVEWAAAVARVTAVRAAVAHEAGYRRKLAGVTPKAEVGSVQAVAPKAFAQVVRRIDVRQDPVAHQLGWQMHHQPW